MNSKQFFIDQIISDTLASRGDVSEIKILDLGCGSAFYVPFLLKKYTNLRYVGVEPIVASYDKALDVLKDQDRAKVFCQLGYDEVAGLDKSSFDIVISMSVLEHVKNLPDFIKMSVDYSKIGGTIVHRYDLGHALYPHNFKAKLHVWLGNNFPMVLPERQFVRYVPEEEVKNLYKFYQTDILKTTYHQLPSLKKLEKAIFGIDGAEAVNSQIYQWEYQNQDIFKNIKLPEREELFPSVAVWGKKVS